MLIKCKACGKDVSENAFSCPNCGEPLKKKGKCRSKKLGFIGIAIFLLGFILLPLDSSLYSVIGFIAVIAGIPMSAIGFSAPSATNN